MTLEKDSRLVKGSIVAFNIYTLSSGGQQRLTSSVQKQVFFEELDAIDLKVLFLAWNKMVMPAAAHYTEAVR